MLKLNIEYFFLFSLIFFFSLISIFFILLSYILVIQQRTKEKTSSYECGFQPFMDTRSKFNIKYYVLAILFIIFDLELIYMIPWVLSLIKLGCVSYYIMFFFLFILTAGFIFEWTCGALDWD